MLKREMSKDSLVIFPQNMRENQFTWLVYFANKSDGSPIFRVVDNSIYAIKRLKAIAEIFNPDGSYNGENKRAERYAICLDQEFKFTEARKLFSVVVGNSAEVLFIDNDSCDENEKFLPVANMSGKLGYEGAYRFALICVSTPKKKARGIAILSEIAEKIPSGLNYWRIEEILSNSLKILLEHGIDRINNIDLVKKYEKSVEKLF